MKIICLKPVKSVTILFVAFISSVALDCNAQIEIDKKIPAEEIFYNDKHTQLFIGELPVLGISSSDFILQKSGKEQVGFENWNSLHKNGFAAKVNVSKYNESIFHFVIELQTGSNDSLNDLFFKLKFLPQNPDLWEECRKDFHWIPNLKSEPSQIASDHVFRSPTVLMMSGNIGAALIPDLDILSKSRPAPHYLDMRFPQNNAPEIIYGIANSWVVPHQYYSKTDEPFFAENGKKTIINKGEP